MTSVAGARFPKYAARLAVLSVASLAVAGCSGTDSSAPQSSAPSAAHASAVVKTQLPPMDSLKSPAQSGKLLVAQSGQGARQIEVPLAKTGSEITVRLVCLGPGAAKVTDGSGGPVLDVAGCNATAAYTTGFTGAKNDREMRLSVKPSVTWRLLVWG